MHRPGIVLSGALAAVLMLTSGIVALAAAPTTFSGPDTARVIHVEKTGLVEAAVLAGHNRADDQRADRYARAFRIHVAKVAARKARIAREKARIARQEAAAAARAAKEHRAATAAVRQAHVALSGGSGYTGMAVVIARCESGGNPRAENPSGASGLYQFMPGTWASASGLAPPASAYSVATQTAVFWKVWDGGAGAGNWSPSRSCWG